MAENYLPPFLVPLGAESTKSPCQTVFNHPRFGPAHALWWNSINYESPEAVFLFVPGNPGLLTFYTEFLSTLHAKHPRSAIFAHAHLGHTPGIPTREYSLSAQIESAIEAVDAIRLAFGTAKIVLSGHSVGAWVALQVLKSRPSDIHQLQLICPTLSHIADTPNGRRLSWLFRSPLPWVISWLSHLTRPLPLSLVFPNWPVLQIAVLRSLLNSRATIFACLSMAHEEMNTIRELDLNLLNEHRHRICLYYATEDDWVAVHKTKITSLYLPDEATRVVENADVPHAFCLTHSTEVASQCSLWLNLSAL
ncbi:Lipid droplet-associated hydrolase [Mycena sanguinolenta]|uniref:Lipid droplet-associated hydrolase n=1 Tax=Mycena sanguinolenta TaxID=230812 RepID=A0A8H6XFV1_9AGAR|nr:Lipid droplet-associated hydrolase [Mycena sanguinolenta]